MTWATLTIGKYEGKTLPQAVIVDPDWFFWACETGVFNANPTLKAQSVSIRWRASHIKIPGDGKFVVQYMVHPGVKKLTMVELVPADRAPHVGSSGAFREPFLE